MKLKLTYNRQGRRPVDLQVVVDPGTSVGDLAGYLAESDPEPLPASKSWSLSLTGSPERILPTELAVADSGIMSGSVIALAGDIGGFDAVRPSLAVAVVVVLSGPDAGKEFPIPAGTSYIGRGADCEVRLRDPMTSRRHAKIHVGESIVISDLGSANGILLGDAEAESVQLGAGESVCLGDTVITIRSVTTVGGVGEAGGVESFNRSPAYQTRYSGRTFVIPAPPTKARSQRFPMIPLFAPLLMGAALYVTTKSTTSLVFMGMSPLMMAGNVAEGQLAGKKAYKNDLETHRQAADDLFEQVVHEAEVEAVTRRSEFPSVEECIAAVTTRSSLLWSRRPDLPGFAQLRLGLGRQPARSKVDLPFARQEDSEGVAELKERFASFVSVEAVPVVTDLGGSGAVGVAGPSDQARRVARAYMVQLAVLHSPEELAVYAMCSPDRTSEWEWLKWLPHCAGRQSPVDCEPLVSTRTGSVELMGALDAVVRTRTEAGRTDDAGALPRLVLLVDEPLESEWSRLVELAERGASCGVHVIWVAGDVSRLPASCQIFVEVSATGEATAGFVQDLQAVSPMAVESLSVSEAEVVARRLSPIVDVASRDDSASDVPRSVSLLSLVGDDVAKSPNRVVERWVANRSILSGPYAPERNSRWRPGNLRAVIGEGASGPHVLDLRVHGPHALVGGTTGSGKSELLQSWIMGMALSNSPQRLTFLLVDYKGGSAFSDCVKLPHTVGLVTDLSPHLVRRALISLAAELRYREHILHRKRAKDLATLEREGDPDAPPSLVIVVDEFAALVREVPEFVDGVVNVAQRGRSLGLHLILATQRPSGVIRDNLRANTNLRIALRMADAADSTDVIGTKAAAGFDPTIPGRAASRTGPTALVPFQTGYAGGWSSAAAARPDIQVATFGFSAKTTWEPPVDESLEQPTEGPTDIERLVTSIVGANELAEVPRPRKPWLAELAAVYDLAKLPSSRRDDNLIFAVGDDPENQRQPTVAFRPDDDGNMAVFGTGGSGKSNLLRTLCIAAGITVRGGPCQVYGVDFGARGLQMIEQLPHVGGVIPGNDYERVERLFVKLQAMIEQRAAEYSRVGAGSITQFRNIADRRDEPRILLLVDGMGGMRTAYEGTEHHRLFESFLAIAGQGRPVGIHVVITADRAGAVPSALGSLIQRRVVLRLAGDNDYAMLGQPDDVLDPKSPPGRGLCDGMEIQVAVLGDSPDLLAQDVAVRSFAAAMRNAGTAPAPPIRRLEEEIHLQELEVEVDGRPSFGIAADTLSATGFVTEGTFTVAGPPGSGRTTTLITLAHSLRRRRPDTRLIYFGSGRSAAATAVDWTRAAVDVTQAAELAAEVADILGEAGPSNPPGAVVIETLADFVQSPADAALQEMIKRVTMNGHLVISDGEPIPLGGLQQLLQIAWASRVGIVLQPEQTDASLFKTQFPRLRKADFPPGRGLYVARGEQPVIVQVAFEGSSPH